MALGSFSHDHSRGVTVDTTAQAALSSEPSRIPRLPLARKRHTAGSDTPTVAALLIDEATQ
jgi:hypothetical protein